MKKETPKQRVGNIGEDLAVRFLVKHGFVIVERNYWKPFGEIDVICKKDKVLHFVEVKTVSRRTLDVGNDNYRPEDNVHRQKLVRIGRTIQAYIFEQHTDVEWKFDVITVELDRVEKTASIVMIPDIIL